MTLMHVDQARPDLELVAAPAEVPVIVGIGLDPAARRQLASAAAGVAVLMFTPDSATAHHMLCGGTGCAPPGEDDADAESAIPLADLDIDPVRRRVRWRGRPLDLSTQERDLFLFLAGEAVRVRTYRQLHSAAWDCRYTDPGPVRAAVKRLRRKLRLAGVPVEIEAVRGAGYRLVESDEAV